MDDFGTGYSSLSQLKMLPVNKLKVDKSFVLNLADDLDDQSIVKATIAMAKALSLKVIAEGVENEASAQLLKNWGCDVMQGYHLARPMPLHRLTQWMEQFNEALPSP